jgi:hypothetical protein
MNSRIKKNEDDLRNPSSDEQISVPVSKPEALIYLGPPLPRGLLNQMTVFRNGLPKHLESHVANCPEIKLLLVPIDRIHETQTAINDLGSAQSVWFKQILSYAIGGARG